VSHDQAYPRDLIYRRRVFNVDVIQLCVRWYVTYRLSHRDLVELMAERGIHMAHSTILRWVARYVLQTSTARQWTYCSNLTAESR